MPDTVIPETTTLLTIKAAAEVTGLSEHTLRAWERRYELLAPQRTASGYRLYDRQTLARVRAMQELVQAGWSPKSAAAELLRRPPPLGDVTDSSAELIEAAAAMDAASIHRIVTESFGAAAFETVVDDWMLPALARLGQAWADGKVTVAGEHLVADALMRRLAAAYDSVRRGQGGPPVLIGAPPGVDHQLGLLAFAVACRRAGLATVYLGAKVPLPAWRDAALRTRAFAVVTSVPQRRDSERVTRVAAQLESLPEVSVWVGGRFQHLVPAPARTLGHLIGPAARTLAASRHG
ncbi:MAG TPA: MerR family transcriptional regulator [Propionicimonas sp.]|nr:MerR family transcriptional regulator [Propionicimonas sp.]HQA78371.1 MerR family transcriptional regulator [Propionicimonas sp.]